jgi:nucleoside-diphosphate-sugar epimerase
VILVTGGAGFVGLNVVEQLRARAKGNAGDDVLVFDTRAPRVATAFEAGDVTDREALRRVFSRHDIRAVIHLAAITAGRERDAREPRRIAEVNLLGTINVLEAARERGVARFVHASTGALYGAAGVGAAAPLDEERDRPVPDAMYGITKYAAERTCLRLAALWDMDVRIGRLATAFGRWEHASGARDRLSPPTEIAKLARRGIEAVFPPLGATDYIYAPDLAAALLALLDARSPKHRVYHLGIGDAWALPQWCALLAERCPGFRWRESTLESECNVLPLSPLTRTRFSNRRLVEDLGWQPRFDLGAAADDYLAWLSKHEF